MDFSGRENIYMNGAMMGFSHREMKDRFDQILEFSELHDFIDAPLRTYSSGMVCRLGFSVAVATDPDVLIIDEILSVGDMHFQRKCVERIYDYKKRGKTLFFCSHSLYDVRQICDHAIWMDHGRMRMAQDQWSPGQHVIDVAVVVRVPEIRAAAALDEARRPAHAAKGPHGAVDAARDNPSRGSEEFFRVLLVVHSDRISTS